MTLIPVDPIMPETPQADLSCYRPNPVNTVPPGSEEGHSRVDDPQSFANAIEEALRRTHVSAQDHVAPNETTAPTWSPVEPSRQDTGGCVTPPPTADTCGADEAGSACSVSTTEKVGPQTPPAFFAWVPVEPAAAAQGLTPTSLPPASTGPAASATESPQPRAEPFPLEQGGEIPARLAAPAAATEDPVLHLPASAPEAQGSEPHAPSGPQTQAAETAPSDPSLLPENSDGHFSPDAESPRLSVPEGGPGASGTVPSSDRALAVSFTMTSEPLPKDPTTGPQLPNSAAAAAEAPAREPNRPWPAEGSTPRVPAMTALPQEETATGPFPPVATAGETPGKPFETAPKAGHPAGRPSEPLAPEEDSPALSDPEQGADDPFQDGPTADKAGAPRTVSSAAPSARPPSQGRERIVSQAGLAGAEETDPLQQAGAKPAEGRTEIPGGPGRGAPAPGPWKSDSVASHLQLHAREVLESSARQFHLRIQGEGLGSMRWDVRLEPGKIAAQALVDTIKLQELVQGQQDALLQRFQELGLEVEHFEVLVDSGSTGERFEGRQEPEPGGAVRPKLVQPSPARAPGLLHSAGTVRGVDLFV